MVSWPESCGKYCGLVECTSEPGSLYHFASGFPTILVSILIDIDRPLTSFLAKKELPNDSRPESANRSIAEKVLSWPFVSCRNSARSLTDARCDPKPETGDMTMNAKLALMTACVIGALTAPAMAQYRTHLDFNGYTYRTPSSTFMHRYDTGATYFRTGNIATYSDNTGTTGSIYYAPAFRMDSFSNAREGWSGSGTTFYRPSFSTYGRTYLTTTPNTYSGGPWRPSPYRFR